MLTVGVHLELAAIERAGRHHHLLRTSDLASLRIGAQRWQRWQDSGLWLPVAPGMFRHAATPLSFEMQAIAGSAWLGRRGGLFGTSALHWLGVDVEAPSRAEFLVPRGLRSIPNWMTIHTSKYWQPAELIGHHGVRTTTATRAIIDMATRSVTARELERAIDSAIRLRRTAVSKLVAALEVLGGRGRRGVIMMRELLLDSGGESILERRFLRLIRVSGLPRPECQVVFRRDTGRAIRVDFSFPHAKLVVEVSGRLGHSTDRDRQRDARRRNHLQQVGQRVIEFTTADVIDSPDYVIRTLASALRVAA